MLRDAGNIDSMSAVRTIFWTAERKRRKLYSMGYDVIDVDSSREGRRGGAALFGFVVTRRSFETRLFQRVDSHTVSPVTRDKKSTGLRFSERWEKSKRMQRERNGNAILPFWMKLYFLDRWLVNGPILDSRLLISF